MILLQVIFWLCLLALIHSYVFYPFITWLLARNPPGTLEKIASPDEFPFVSILLAAHNEETVIGDKLRSMLQTDYPADRFEILIGSDASTDNMDSIVKQFAAANPSLKFTRFHQRSGKISIINQLVTQSKGEILLLTDANVFFTPSTIGELIHHFSRNEVAVVAGNIQPRRAQRKGVADQESFYQRFENKLKHREGLLWGAMMGAFGGCYAVRRSFFSPTPSNFIVDDFYITLAALEKGGKAISEPHAVCYEDVSELMKEEFRRKSRIGAGNFQILGRFWKLLSPARGGIALAFLSHKVLRWLGPFFIAGTYLSSFVLARQHPFYSICFWIETILFLICLLDVMLSNFKIQLPGARYISHFFVMNLALLNGFFKFITGIEHNVWQPTQRNQSHG